MRAVYFFLSFPPQQKKEKKRKKRKTIRISSQKHRGRFVFLMVICYYLRFCLFVGLFVPVSFPFLSITISDSNIKWKWELHWQTPHWGTRIRMRKLTQLRYHLFSGYGKVPKHTSIACRQQTDFVGRKKRGKWEYLMNIIYLVNPGHIL